MHSFLSFPNGGLRLCCISRPFPSAYNKFFLYEKDGSQHFLFQGNLLTQFRLSTRCEGNRSGRPLGNNFPARIGEDADKLKGSTTSGNEISTPSNRNEILALFKRIQSSISKKGSTVTKRRISNDSKEEGSKFTRQRRRRVPSSSIEQQQAERVLRTPQEDPRRTQNEGEDKGLPQSTASARDKAPANAQVSRLMSNFVKKSPIPPPSTVEEKSKEANEEYVPKITVSEMLELQKIDKMKLNELKELARRKGVKGYSKLRKGELVELLKGLPQSSS